MQQLIDFLIGQYMFDMWVLQQWWMWAPLGIPGVFYVAFMWLKWVTLAIPLAAAASGFKTAFIKPIVDGYKQARKDA